MENDQDGAGTAGAGVSRGQNQLHLLPEDWQAAATVIEPLLERLDAASAQPQMLVVATDADAAAGIARRLAPGADLRDLRILAATESRRAKRVQRAAPAQIIAGAPGVLLDLIQSTTLKADGVKVVVLAWVDDLGEATPSLEALMGEVPKDAARLILASSASPEVEQLVERYARRARKMQTVAEPGSPVSLSYVASAEEVRPQTLRRVLDTLDPDSASVVARNAESRAEAEAQLRSLGYGGASSSVMVADVPQASAQLIVLYDMPASEEELRKMVSGTTGARVVALVTARQLASLRRLAGGAVTPLALPEAAARARSREEALRDDVRAMLATGQISRELLTLEPLLADHDGIEVAAALLRLLEAERARPAAAGGAAAVAPMTLLFVNVGDMDGLRPGDLVGAITNEAGISKGEMGRVEIRERHSTVEVATAVANAVVAKLNGVTIKGRRAMVKVDEGRERPSGPRRDRDSGGPRRDRGDRGAPRRDRPGRPSRPTRPR